jgi:CheY-like chemotaxis protein
MSISPLQILVVEDNSNSREIICEMLAALGHSARSATSAEDAVEILQTRKFDVLLADINLPGISGIDLAEKVVKDMPGIKVIFASGYGYLVNDKTDFDFVLLPKPYGLAQLKHALSSVFPENTPRPLG